MAGTCVGNPYAFVAELMQFTYVARSFHALGRSGCAHAEARGGTRRDAFMTAGGIYRCGSLALGDLTVDVEAAPGTTATFLTRQAWSPR
jgi:hypothetical protein